jgi:hypothetical protein
MATEHLGDRGAHVVVTDLAGRHPSEPLERMNVPLEECLLAAGGEDPVARFAGERHPEREQHAGDGLTAQVDHDLAEVDLRLGARPVKSAGRTL